MRSICKKALVVLPLVFLVAAGCAKSSTPSSGGLSIVSPRDGTTATSPVRLVLSVSGVEIGPPESGKMHFHLHIDGSSNYEVITSTTASVPLPSGQHTIKVVLAEPNHDETSTSASATFTVSAGGASPSPSPTSGGYHY